MTKQRDKGEAQHDTDLPVMVISPAIDQCPNTSIAKQMQISGVGNKHPTICTSGTLSCLPNKQGLQEQIGFFPVYSATKSMTISYSNHGRNGYSSC